MFIFIFRCYVRAHFFMTMQTNSSCLRLFRLPACRCCPNDFSCRYVLFVEYFIFAVFCCLECAFALFGDCAASFFALTYYYVRPKRHLGTNPACTVLARFQIIFGRFLGPLWGRLIDIFGFASYLFPTTAVFHDTYWILEEMSEKWNKTPVCCCL